MKICRIIRGLPGSGKSYWTSQWTKEQPDSVVCSADKYFIASSGKYQFRAKDIGSAHGFSLSTFLNALKANTKLVIVDNTGILRWEYANYISLATSFGYKVEIYELAADSLEDVHMVTQRNAHGVPLGTVGGMREKMQVDGRIVKRLPVFGYNEDARERAFHSARFVYSGLFLSADSQAQLMSVIPQIHPLLEAGHVTLQHRPKHLESHFLQLDALFNMSKISISVSSFSSNERIQACSVKFLSHSRLLCKNENPHITVSRRIDAENRESNVMLGEGEDHEKVFLEEPVELQVRAGAVIFIPEIGGYAFIGSKKEWQMFRRCRSQDIFAEIEETKQQPVSSSAPSTRTSTPSHTISNTCGLSPKKKKKGKNKPIKPPPGLHLHRHPKHWKPHYVHGTHPSTMYFVNAWLSDEKDGTEHRVSSSSSPKKKQCSNYSIRNSIVY